ncbi:hypothetical protein HanHA300_Chr07g0249221 [Helianthus annuus]|uniref:Putative reverse transcriptase zinc-binding domain-containing protein n=1 Tax=Helianthus annuus TaxID=4232 RepID=A0A251UC42_HELAN|nr:uncharacterized protein LOC110868348 isoform X2 [Helianthus annuus]XP_035831114.1 uncharacterized protein LOC110868348 isoform X2 [Helianthus annuus]KAJ0550731.1 hypothetical protein HanHA300_Chr07g0249221 [Helianthus annuus]KAJ0557561.1 hypothetical protein HanIR_Chr07g0326521 [Helianthus annuus]KAJ0563697.1 hypothetical protein HanHA89_Chr07g0266031 [Helianthus annuus]KAJ0729030.1 hypothetical protein HanLR1_Chr07g0248341 [Helianthus annuus]KAJ0731782.1 hypothetical protein HanOQP8_Chr07
MITETSIHVSGKAHVYFNGFLYQIASSDTASWQLLWPVLLRGCSLHDVEIQELGFLSEMMVGLQLNGNRDKWDWEPEASGSFSISSCRKLLCVGAVPYYPFEWVKWVPKKTNIFGWRAEQNRLPTLAELQKRNIYQGYIMCRSLWEIMLKRHCRN